MVKVSKIAVWKIGNEYVEDSKEAEKAIRTAIISEMIAEVEEGQILSAQDTGKFVAESWDAISAKVKAAMAGT